jgi:hypothetical protein
VAIWAKLVLGDFAKHHFGADLKHHWCFEAMRTTSISAPPAWCAASGAQVAFRRKVFCHKNLRRQAVFVKIGKHGAHLQGPVLVMLIEPSGSLPNLAGRRQIIQAPQFARQMARIVNRSCHVPFKDAAMPQISAESVRAF